VGFLLPSFDVPANSLVVGFDDWKPRRGFVLILMVRSFACS